MAATLSPVAATLILGNPTVIHVAGAVRLNIPVMNVGDIGLVSLLCTNISLGSAQRSSPVGFPIVVGQLAASNTTRFAARFSDAGLVVGNRYLLTVRGSYVVNGVVYGLTLNRYVQLPAVTVPAEATLSARVDVSTSANYWNYKLVNTEASGSNQFIASLALTVFAPVTVTGIPPGWQVDTDNASYVLWTAADYVLPYPNQVAPGAALAGFQLMSPRLGSEATASSIGGWNHSTDDAGLNAGDYTLTPNRFA